MRWDYPPRDINPVFSGLIIIIIIIIIIVVCFILSSSSYYYYRYCLLSLLLQFIHSLLFTVYHSNLEDSGIRLPAIP